ncbi:cellulase family glycosylhydrolase [Rhodocytophaga aerolata]|uniref:Cellulase family glycosylhydrolase n=1 Tax=Rhodocytophaga aerolata TaxID=455078 RepID=A0ABT8RJK5_9BACT|nr:cellulase family glycosylhydrolase [Rhodocytophaga aerolata]MDO1451614.1 cellulase family glycosylhydrolase [Rhodocytophaga aerolata]
MKIIYLLSLLFSGLFLIAPASAQNRSNLRQVLVKGNQFVTAEGKPIVFRGLNSSDPDKLEKSGHWQKSYFEQIKQWGATILRFPIHPHAWRSRGKQAYLQLLDQGVAWASELGLYVILDWHSIGNLKNELYQHPMYDTTLKETFEFWRTISDHYKDNTTVAFFELFNEPTLMGGKLGTCSWGQWKEMMGGSHYHYPGQ